MLDFLLLLLELNLKQICRYFSVNMYVAVLIKQFSILLSWNYRTWPSRVPCVTGILKKNNEITGGWLNWHNFGNTRNTWGQHCNSLYFFHHQKNHSSLPVIHIRVNSFQIWGDPPWWWIAWKARDRRLKKYPYWPRKIKRNFYFIFNNYSKSVPLTLALLNLPKGKSLGRSKPATNS